MRILLRAILLCGPLLAWHAAAQTAATGARLTWYGIYTVETSRLEDEPNGLNSKKWRSTLRRKPETNRDRIPIGDTRFGIGFVLTGPVTGAKMRVRAVVRFPLPGAREATSGHMRLAEEASFDWTVGQEHFFGERFADFPDPPTGVWTFQLWDGDRLLLEKSFTVVMDGT